MEKTDPVLNFDTIVTENQNSVIISKDDLKLILDILVVISKRGGFLIEEYKAVGEVFDRLKVKSINL